MLTIKSSIKLVGLGVIAIYLSSCTGQPSPREVAQRLKASVVLIKTHDGTNGGHGTGFFVREKGENLLPSQQRIIRQAQERVQRGVLEKTFKWGIPINTYLGYRPAVAVPDAAGISATFAWFLFGCGAVAGGLLVFFGVKPLLPTAETEGRRRREAEANARELERQVQTLEKELAAALGQQGEQQQAPRQPLGGASSGEVELKSARGLDYTSLRDLLAAQKFYEADKETYSCMLKATGRVKGSLNVEDIDNFPCEDLRTIDGLWVKYSDGRFGFSVQKEIYQELGGTKEYDEKIWEVFGDRVGWRKGGSWLKYESLAVWSYSGLVPQIPPGQLPCWCSSSFVGIFVRCGLAGWLWYPLFSRKDL